MVERDWHKCYGQGWGSLCVPDAYAHPAKYSRGLIRRIYAYAFERGWFKAGDVVVDPFGGVALGALHAMQRGLNWVGVELEQPFIDMGRSCDCTGISKADWVRFQGRWEKARYLEGRYWCPRCLTQARNVIAPLPQATLFNPRPPTASYERNSGKMPSTESHHYEGNLETWHKLNLSGTAQLLQGDSRELAAVLGRAAAGSVSSPPFGGSELTKDAKFCEVVARDRRGGSHLDNSIGCYDSVGNLGGLRASDADHAQAIAGAASSLDKNSLPLYNVSGGGNDERDARDREVVSDVPSRKITSRDSRSLRNRSRDCAKEVQESRTEDAHIVGGTQASVPDRQTSCYSDERPRSLGLEGGQGPTPVSRESGKGTMRSLRGASESVHPSQGFRPLQRCPGQSTGALCELPPKPTQESILGCGQGGEDSTKKQRTSGVGKINGLVSSPPYAQSLHHEGHGIDLSKLAKPAYGPNSQAVHPTGYGRTLGQLAALPEGEHGAALAQGAVSSPPWEASVSTMDEGCARRYDGWAKNDDGSNRLAQSLLGGGYGASNGQLGQEQGDTFWTAARTIMEQLWLVLEPGAVAIWVVKSFVRKGKRVDFPGRWRELGEACGFETVEWIRAWLVEDRGAQFTLEGDLEKRTIQRKSFFRRLAERKGSPRIDYEVVLVQQKPVRA